MNKNRLTEDIDVTMRALKIGAKIKYDVDIVSTELAPVTLGAFTNQRLRWAEGWFQVSLHNAIDCITSEYTNLQQKFGFLLLLIWREIFFHIPSHTLIVFVVYCVKSGTVLIGWDSTPFALLSFILPMFSAMFTWTLSNPFIRKHLSWYFWYWLVSYPYATYQTWLGLLGQYRAATKYHKWKVTPRGPSKQKNEENVQEGNVQPQQEDKPPAV
jgi:cellulose synthase/poly-beta-1,6-N-acetylglucosamine synthase-like glycosyltransferase